MDAFDWTLALELVFVVTAMLYVGLSVTWAQLTALLRERRLLARALLANVVLAPALAVLLVALIPMAPDAQVALLLLGVAPGGLNVLQFTTRIGGRLAQAATLLFALTLVALVTTPLAVLAMPLPRAPGALGAAEHILAFLLAAALPIAVGAWLRRHRPDRARRLARPANLVSALAFVAATVVGSALKREAVGVIDGGALVAFAVFVAGTLLIGWLLGGPARADRQLLATTTSIRNAGLCLLFALTLYPGTAVDVAVLAFIFLMIPPNAVLTLSGLVRERRRARRGHA